MAFFIQYPYFRNGKFFDGNGEIKAYISKDGNTIRSFKNSEIIGYTKNDRLYDIGSNYIGCFKNNMLIDIGGNIRGYYSNKSTFDTQNEPSILTIILLAIIIIGTILLITQFKTIFF